jgi:pimeloyl-ACP methyl ester carboxylesterase
MIFKRLSFYCAFVVLYFLLTVPAQARNHVATNRPCYDSTIKGRIAEERFITINGIELWVTIKGERSKPVIFFLHGGPGSPISPYSDNVYKTWEKDFIIVQWDQRGTGRTFGRNSPGELTPEYLQSHPLTVAQMADDGIALTEYLLQYLGKQKAILFGSSWGSLLGVTIATKKPNLYYAYIGHSQIVTPDSDLPMYNKVYRMAQADHDQESLSILDTLGKPPYARARNVGRLYKIVKKYEKINAAPAPRGWFVETAQYNNAKDEQDRSDGDDYSFVNFVGDQRLGVPSMRANIHFLEHNREFKVPVYLIQGEWDILTPKESTREYFDQIKAPKKEYILLPHSAHGFNEAVVEAQYRICKSIKAS